MRRSARRQQLGAAGVLLLLAGLSLLALRASGTVTWHITAGSSMMPAITPGTLVVVSRQPEYAVGDVVAYRSAELGQVVLHRVVEVQPTGRLVLQGDANTWLDTETPTHAEALGAQRLQVPTVGPLLTWLAQPAPMGAGAAALTLPFLGVHRRARRRRSGSAVTVSPTGLPLSGPSWTDDDLDEPARPLTAERAFRLPSSGPTWDPDLDLHPPAPRPTDAAAAGAPGPAPAAPPGGTASVGASWRSTLLPRLAAAAQAPQIPKAVETGVAGVLVALLLLAVATTGGPLVQRSGAAPTAEHVVTWGYAAQVEPGLVYENGDVRTGDTLYTKLVQTADVTADLEIAAPPGTPVTGTWALDVVVEDDSGWRRTTRVGTPTEVDGTTSRLSVPLPVADLLALSERAAAESGVEVSGRRVSVQGRLDLTVGSSQLTAEPLLAFVADDDKLRLAPGIELTQRGSASLAAQPRTATVTLAGLSLPATDTRASAVAGALIALATLGLLRYGRRRETEDQRIMRTSGHLLVPMEDIAEPDRTVDVSSFQALASLASSYERMVLYGDHDGLRVYLVLDDGVAYRYYCAKTAAALDAAQAAEAARAAEVASA